MIDTATTTIPRRAQLSVAVTPGGTHAYAVFVNPGSNSQASCAQGPLREVAYRAAAAS